MRLMLLIIFLLTIKFASAQQNRIKFGLLGVPMFQSGFGMANIGFERLNKNLSASWQLHFSFAGGSPATDIGVTSRKWITAEKSFYFKKRNEKFNFYYSFFTEAGKRNKQPGFIRPSPDSILKKTNTFEINPGTGIGIQFRLRKKIKMELQAGPKLIIASGKKYYYNSIIKLDFTEPVNKLGGGYRFFGCIYYQF